MKPTNLDGPGANAGAVVRGWKKAQRASGEMLVTDALGTEVLANAMLFYGLSVSDDGDGTAIINGTGGSGVNGLFDVTDPTYGAVGDGVTVDCAAINAAIAALNANGGGVLYFPTGSYLCDSGLDAITVPCIVRGEGRGSPSGAGPGSEVVCSHATANLFNMQDHFQFQFLQLRNTHATPTAGALVAVTSTGDASSITGCLFRGGWMGLDWQEGGGWNLHDTWFTGQRKYSVKIRNISSPDGGDQAISNCWFYAFNSWTPDAAIRQESAGGLKVTNCKFNTLNAAGNYVHGIDLAASVANSSILLVHGNSFENVTGDAIHVTTSGVNWDMIMVIANQFGLYSNSTGNAVEITCANLGEVDEVVILGNIFQQTGGGSAAAINLTKVNNARIGSNVRDGFGSLLAQSGCTNIVEDATTGAPSTVDYLVGTASGGLSAEIVVGTTPGGELGGTWASPTVDTTHAGSTHIALSSATPLAAAGAGAAGSGTEASKDDHVHPASGAGGLLTVDPGTPTYDTSGPDVVVAVATVWGYDADGPYYDSAGAATGEEAQLAFDPEVGDYVVVPYNP